MNPERRLLVRHMQQPGLCVRNTACSPPAAKAAKRSDFVPDESCADGGEGTLGPAHLAPSLPVAMASARFCFSPRGWNGGDSDRYLAALLYGCTNLDFVRRQTQLMATVQASLTVVLASLRRPQILRRSANFSGEILRICCVDCAKSPVPS